MSDSGIVPLRPIDRRIEPCVICGANIYFNTCTAPDRECPEMCRFGGSTWIGILDDGNGNITLAFCCSEDCMRRLVR